MLFSVVLLLAAVVTANPVIVPRATTSTKATCSGRASVFNALTSYTSGAQFCSTFLPYTTSTSTVSRNATKTLTRTSTVTSGLVIVTAPVTTLTSTISSTITSTVTVTGDQNMALKRAVTSSTTSSKTVPTALKNFSPSQLSAGCSCVNPKPTTTITRTSTGTTTRATTVKVSRTTTTTPTAFETVTSTYTSFVTDTVIPVPTTTSTSSSSSSALLTSSSLLATSAPPASTSTSTTSSSSSETSTTTTIPIPTSFYLRTSDDLYLHVFATDPNDKTYSSGALVPGSREGADTFSLNTLDNSLYVSTPGSGFAGDTMSSFDEGDAYQFEYANMDTYMVKAEAGSDTATCRITKAGLLSCGSTGADWWVCNSGLLEVGTVAGYELNQYGYDCVQITLTVVAA